MFLVQHLYRHGQRCLIIRSTSKALCTFSSRESKHTWLKHYKKYELCVDCKRPFESVLTFGRGAKKRENNNIFFGKLF